MVAGMLIDLSDQPPADRVGAKAARLGWLIAQGWPVPAGGVAPFEVTELLLGPGAEEHHPALRDTVAGWIDPGKRYIVRSSANVEDQGGRSFAGQFLTLGDLAGVDDVVAAIQRVARSGRSAFVREYSTRVGVDPDSVRVAAIVQQMVPPVASGVAFSRNPITGARQVVIEAVPGAGEELVGRGADALRWVSGTGESMQGPETAVLPARAVHEVATTVRAIEAARGLPVDVEWVWDGARLHVVQWRPITGLATSPRVWSARIARDVLPGLIPPLVWSVNVPVVSAAWTDLLHSALGDLGLAPDQLVRAFGYRAYFNTTALGDVFTSLGMPADALERMRDGDGRSGIRPPASVLLRRTPRLAGFAGTLATWLPRATAERADLDRAAAEQGRVDVAALTDAQLMQRAATLSQLMGRAARLNIVTPLLADTWAASVRRAARARGLDPGSIDPGQELAAVRALDPAHALACIEPDDEQAWQAFLARFGHLSDSPNDCSQPTWAEQPEVIRALLPTRGGAHLEPGRRGLDRSAPGSQRAALLAATARIGRPRMARRWDRAARYRLAREQVGYTYARVYALFRPTFLEAGRRLAERGTLDAAADVFLLTRAELAEALAGRLPGARGLVSTRRQEMAEAADLQWPETIVGDDPMPIRGRSQAPVLTGVPTAAGRHIGPARVVTSLAARPEIGAEDVLVLAASDVSWTPLLLRAGAVVTETGGMLSHASIVARELGIPCVASVAGATRIPEGRPVCVDGAAGEVVVLDDLGSGTADAQVDEEA